MSKERLEEIKSIYKEDVYDCKLGRFDINWLIEQAELGILQQEQFHDYQTQNLRLQERVRELEHKLYQDHRQEVLEVLYEQNKRYREALEFYADKENYRKTYDSFSDTGHSETVVQQDAGKKARNLLRGINNAGL